MRRAQGRAIKVAYHLVDAANWPSVQRVGLMSAARLMLRYGEMAVGTLRVHRPADVQLPSGELIRDQSPMPPHRLVRGLDGGLSPADWFEAVNSKVFFWLDPERLNRHRAAYASRPQIVLSVDAATMLTKYHDTASVTPINVGNARRRPAPRNMSTFVPYAHWVADGWTHESITGRPARKSGHFPVELTVDDVVPDVLKYVLAVTELAPGEPFLQCSVPYWRSERTGSAGYAR